MVEWLRQGRAARIGLAVVALGAATILLAAPVLADGPVDIRGTWSGNFDSTIGVFANTFTFDTEDVTTGAVYGSANSGTYTVAGTVTGNIVDFTAAMGSYSARFHVTVSPDGLTMTGPGRDSNGTTGTLTVTRQSGPPPSANPAASAAPTAAPGCSFGGSGGNFQPLPIDTVDPSVIQVVKDVVSGQSLHPTQVAIDSGDPRGRVFVAHALSRTIGVISGRPNAAADIRIETSFDVGGVNVGMAVDPASGHLFVADAAHCQVDVIDGRAGTPSVVQTINLPGNPNDVAFDPRSNRLFVAVAETSQVLAFGSDLGAPVSTLSVSGGPTRLAVDGDRGFVYVATTSPPAAAPTSGSIVTIDDRGSIPSIAGEIGGAIPSAIVVDPVTHEVIVANLANGTVVPFASAANGTLTQGQAASIDADPNARFVDSLVVLPAAREVLVPLLGATHANLFAIGPDGSLRFDRAVAGVASGAGAALDPATGRVFVAELREGVVAVVSLAAPVQSALPSLVTALPGPLEISLAPADIARSVGITAFLMLLLGAPTPLFNSTLSAKRKLIERWLRRKLPRALRSRTSGRGGVALSRLFRTLPGLGLYMVLVTLLYSFLDPGFPVTNGGLVFGMTLFGIVVGTIVSQVPGEIYVRRHFGKGGQVRVALWVLGIAAICVVLTRVAGVSPGYVYGIIGGYSFTVALSADDKGRMAFRGMSVLLAVGFVAWFLRIPFQPSVGVIGGDAGTIGNSLLADLFVSAVQGAAIGLIPLRFLTGETLFSWNKGRWTLLWGLSLVLFAHVILYPVSSFEPHPNPSSLVTVALTVAVYGAIAVGFWGFFARRDRRRAKRVAAVAGAE